MASIKTTTTRETDEKFEEIFEMKSDINLLKRDVLLFGEYFKRIDAGMEKVGDLTNSMYRMITLHEERIGQQMKDDDKLSKLIEQRRVDTEKGFEKVIEKIEEVKKDMNTRFEELQPKIWKLDFVRAALVGVVSLFAAGLFSGWFSNMFAFLKTWHH